MKDVTDVFPERLVELRGGTSKTEASNGIGISRISLGYYETGERKPDIEVLTKIAKYYEVSTDYLLGLTDVKNPDSSVRVIAEETGLSEEAINAIREYKDDDLLTALNFLIENEDFSYALVWMYEYEYSYARKKSSDISFDESSEENRFASSMELLSAVDSETATEYRINKSFQKSIDSWMDIKKSQIDLKSPEELKSLLFAHILSL